MLCTCNNPFPYCLNDYMSYYYHQEGQKIYKQSTDFPTNQVISRLSIQMMSSYICFFSCSWFSFIKLFTIVSNNNFKNWNLLSKVTCIWRNLITASKCWNQWPGTLHWDESIRSLKKGANATIPKAGCIITLSSVGFHYHQAFIMQ